MSHNTQEIWWERYLPKAVFYRLDECRTTKDDIPTLLDVRWRYAQDTGEATTKEECLEEVVELLECNGLVDVTELTNEEWDKMTTE